MRSRRTAKERGAPFVGRRWRKSRTSPSRTTGWCGTTGTPHSLLPRPVPVEGEKRRHRQEQDGHPLLSKEIAVSRASAHKHAKLETLTLDFFDIDFRLLGTGPRSFSITPPSSLRCQPLLALLSLLPVIRFSRSDEGLWLCDAE